MWLDISLNCSQTSTSQATYTFTQLLNTLGYFYRFDNVLSSQRFVVYYGPIDQAPPNVNLLIPEQPAEKPEKLVNALANARPYYAPIGKQQKIWSYDLIQAAFYLLSRQEELVPGARDKLGRFSTEYSLLHQLNLSDRPILNQALLVLDEAIQQIAVANNVGLLKKSIWPHPYHYAASLSHDVDELGYRDPKFGWQCLQQFAQSKAPHALYKGVGTLGQWGLNKLLNRNYFRWHLDKWLKTEDEAGFRSTFYFVAAETSAKMSRDPNYNVTEPKLYLQLRQMIEQGWEVGVHGSFNSFNNAPQLKAERDRLQNLLGTQVEGIRQHYLRFSAPDTWLYQTQAGFVYDTTLGFRDRLGFRAGLTTPFNPYNLSVNTPFSILEMPLTLMDTVLFWQHNLDEQAGLVVTLNYLKQVQAVQGHIVLLWHQVAYDQRRRPGWFAVYQQLLYYLAQDSTSYVDTMGNVAKWWQARQSLNLIKNTATSSGWHVVLRADKELFHPLSLEIVGRGWQLISASDQRVDVKTRGQSVVVVIPSLAKNQEILLKFTPV